MKAAVIAESGLDSTNSNATKQGELMAVSFADLGFPMVKRPFVLKYQGRRVEGVVETPDDIDDQDADWLRHATPKLLRLLSSKLGFSLKSLERNAVIEWPSPVKG